MGDAQDSVRNAKIHQAPVASIRDAKHRLCLPPTDNYSFLKDLSVERIDNINKYLWVAGRPYPPRALSAQRVLEREIIPTTDTSLHLVWTTGRIFIRHLPTCLLSVDFYETCLSPSSGASRSSALGLFCTATSLFCHPSWTSTLHKKHI